MGDEISISMKYRNDIKLGTRVRYKTLELSKRLIYLYESVHNLVPMHQAPA